MLSNTLLYCVGAAVYAAQAVRASPVNRAVPSVGCSSPWVVLGIDIINDLEGSQGVHWCSSVLGKYQMVTQTTTKTTATILKTSTLSLATTLPTASTTTNLVISVYKSTTAFVTNPVTVVSTVDITTPVTVTATVDITDLVVITSTLDVTEPVTVTSTINVTSPFTVTPTIDITTPVTVTTTVDLTTPFAITETVTDIYSTTVESDITSTTTTTAVVAARNLDKRVSGYTVSIANVLNIATSLVDGFCSCEATGATTTATLTQTVAVAATTTTTLTEYTSTITPKVITITQTNYLTTTVLGGTLTFTPIQTNYPSETYTTTYTNTATSIIYSTNINVATDIAFATYTNTLIQTAIETFTNTATETAAETFTNTVIETIISSYTAIVTEVDTVTYTNDVTDIATATYTSTAVPSPTSFYFQVVAEAGGEYASLNGQCASFNPAESYVLSFTGVVANGLTPTLFTLDSEGGVWSGGLQAGSQVSTVDCSRPDSECDEVFIWGKTPAQIATYPSQEPFVPMTCSMEGSALDCVFIIPESSTQNLTLLYAALQQQGDPYPSWYTVFFTEYNYGSQYTVSFQAVTDITQCSAVPSA